MDPILHLTFGQTEEVPMLPESDVLDADDPHVVTLSAGDPLLRPSGAWFPGPPDEGTP